MRPIHLLVGGRRCGRRRGPVPTACKACGNAMILATDENVPRHQAGRGLKLNDGRTRCRKLPRWPRRKLLPALRSKLAQHDGQRRHRGQRPRSSGTRALARLHPGVRASRRQRSGPGATPCPGNARPTSVGHEAFIKGLSLAKPGDAAARPITPRRSPRPAPLRRRRCSKIWLRRDVLRRPLAIRLAHAALPPPRSTCSGRDAALAKCKTMAAKPASACCPSRGRAASTRGAQERRHGPRLETGFGAVVRKAKVTADDP